MTILFLRNNNVPSKARKLNLMYLHKGEKGKKKKKPCNKKIWPFVEGKL